MNGPPPSSHMSRYNLLSAWWEWMRKSCFPKSMVARFHKIYLNGRASIPLHNNTHILNSCLCLLERMTLPQRLKLSRFFFLCHSSHFQVVTLRLVYCRLEGWENRCWENGFKLKNFPAWNMAGLWGEVRIPRFANSVSRILLCIHILFDVCA